MQEAFNKGSPAYIWAVPWNILSTYGNWCGMGWSGGTVGTGDPVDLMDAACKAHDLGYVAADAYWEPRFAMAGGNAERRAVCDAWRADWRTRDVTMANTLAALPYLDTTNPSPDNWGYNASYFELASHPLTGARREEFRALLVGYFSTQTLHLLRITECLAY
jgi:hypothetical protein